MSENAPESPLNREPNTGQGHATVSRRLFVKRMMALGGAAVAIDALLAACGGIRVACYPGVRRHDRPCGNYRPPCGRDHECAGGDPRNPLWEAAPLPPRRLPPPSAAWRGRQQRKK